MPNRPKCHSQFDVEVGNSALFLSSHVATETACGLHDTPWLLTAPKGQQISLMLTDFAWTNNTDEGPCALNYGYILDTGNNDVINICGGRSRKKHLYLSSGSQVQITLQNSVLGSNNFLIEYKGIVKMNLI